MPSNKDKTNVEDSTTQQGNKNPEEMKKDKNPDFNDQQHGTRDKLRDEAAKAGQGQGGRGGQQPPR